MLRPGSFTLILAALVVMAPVAARADLAGAPAQPPPLQLAEQQVLEANPDLAAIAGTAPWALRRVLSHLSAAPRDMNGPALWRDETDPENSRLLGRNPALQVIYQASPEAAAELLALIRTAAGTGGKRSID